ncbi:hypothetical protein GF312_22435, partial [Candidatus Poribacteria bacterium]|nr:hypothetical protein [Candidatus Poribacteria bacterium]
MEDKRFICKEDTPEFLAIGHFTHDVTEHGLILGGAAAYSSLAALKLGIETAIVTSVGTDFLHYERFKDISVTLVDSNYKETTTYLNIYNEGKRTQFIKGISATINPEHVPT